MGIVDVPVCTRQGHAFESCSNLCFVAASNPADVPIKQAGLHFMGRDLGTPPGLDLPRGDASTRTPCDLGKPEQLLPCPTEIASALPMLQAPAPLVLSQLLIAPAMCIIALPPAFSAWQNVGQTDVLPASPIEDRSRCSSGDAEIFQEPDSAMGADETRSAQCTLRDLVPPPPGLQLPNMEMGELPSMGSAEHAAGSCRPCFWFWKSQGCNRGTLCNHCHLCLPDKLRTQRKAARSLQLLARPLLQQQTRHLKHRCPLESLEGNGDSQGSRADENECFVETPTATVQKPRRKVRRGRRPGKKSTVYEARPLDNVVFLPGSLPHSDQRPVEISRKCEENVAWKRDEQFRFIEAKRAVIESILTRQGAAAGA